MTDPAAHTPCDGSSECASERHMHGCFADRGNCDHPSEHAAHTPSDSTGAPNVDTLVETVRKRGLARRTHMIGSDQDWRGHFIITEAELSDLAATARRSYPESWNEEIRAVEADRDRLARRVAELEAAMRTFVDEYDFHAADYLAQRVDGEEARVFTARTVELLMEHQRAARKVLAGGGGRA